MKKFVLMMVALLAVALPKVAQGYEVEGPYVGAFSGFNFLSSSSHDHSKAKFHPGWLAGAQVGYAWCGGWRSEFEVSYRHNKVKSYHYRNDAGDDVGGGCGNFHAWSFMANGYYDLPTCWCVSPFIGAGIGYDVQKFSKAPHGLADKKNGFAWQILAGLGYPIDDCLEMALEYRFHKGNYKRLYSNAIDVRVNWIF